VRVRQQQLQPFEMQPRYGHLHLQHFRVADEREPIQPIVRQIPQDFIQREGATLEHHLGPPLPRLQSSPGQLQLRRGQRLPRLSAPSREVHQRRAQIIGHQPGQGSCGTQPLPAMELQQEQREDSAIQNQRQLSSPLRTVLL